MISRRQIWGLVALTLMWGVNWPMIKYSLRERSPLYFRVLTMSFGALINCGFTQVIWFDMARHLSPATSAMSVMAVPLPPRQPATSP